MYMCGQSARQEFAGGLILGRGVFAGREKGRAAQGDPVMTTLVTTLNVSSA